MGSWRICIVTLWLVALALPAQARSSKQKVMVLEFPPVRSIDPTTLKTLNEYLAGSVRDQGFDVITPGQIGAVLGVEKQRQLLGCSESSCLAEIGGALGVDDIVIASLALLESDSVITLNVVNQKGLSVGSQRKIVKGHSVENMLPAIDAMVPRLMAQARGEKVPDLAATPGEPPAGGLQASAEAHPTTHPTGSYVLMGTGVAAVVASVVVGAMASSASKEYRTGFTGTSDTQSAAQSKAKNLALISTVLTGAGVAAIGGGAVWWYAGASEGAP